MKKTFTAILSALFLSAAVAYADASAQAAPLGADAGALPKPKPLGALDVAKPSQALSAPFLGLPTPAELESADKARVRYVMYKTPCFIIIAQNTDALSAAKSVAESAEEMFAEYVGSKMMFEPPLTLQIVPENSDTFKGDFAVSDFDTAHAVISARWVENLPFDGFCKLVSGAILRRMALQVGGSKAADAVPFWLELAFAKNLECKIAASGVFTCARAACAEPQDSLRRVFNYSRGGNADFEMMELNSYWTLRTLEGVLGKNKNFQAFFRRCLAGESPESLLKSVQAETKFSDFDTRWKCAVLGEIYSRMGGVLTTEASRAELARQSVVAVEDTDGELVSLSDTQLWQNRKNPRVRRTLNERIAEIKISLLYINPAYYDALLAAGQVMEAVIADDKSAFDAARESFIKSYRIGFGVEKRARELLTANLEELKKSANPPSPAQTPPQVAPAAQQP